MKKPLISLLNTFLQTLAIMLVNIFVTTSVFAETPKTTSAEKTAPPAATQLPIVDVLTTKAERVTLTENLPARLEPSREAIIVPRISGIIEQRSFREGSSVNAGDLLYRLDNDTYLAALKTAEANLQQAKASRNLYASMVKRYTPLLKEKAISPLEYDQARANLNIQEANILAANAAIDTAKVNLNYTNITAPISGRIGTSYVNEGSYVTASVSKMAKIQQVNPMHIRITQNASTLVLLQRAIKNNQIQSDNVDSVELLLDDGTPYEYKGRFLFIDQSVDAETGEVVLKAEIPNPNFELLPGMYVRVILPVAVYPQAYLIPQQAVTRDAAVDSVLIVNPDGSFAPRLIKIVGQKDNYWIVTSGLEDNLKVIVDGTAKLAFGAKKVQTRPWQDQSNTTNDPPHKETAAE